MNQTGRISFYAFCLLALVLLPACAGMGAWSRPARTPTSVTISVAGLQEDYGSYEGQLVSVRGYGVSMLTAPLCPGYVGMDTRLRFVGEADCSFPAALTSSISGTERSGALRTFQAFVRLFNGEIGCPGSLQSVTFPYLEIVGVEQ